MLVFKGANAYRDLDITLHQCQESLFNPRVVPHRYANIYAILYDVCAL